MLLISIKIWLLGLSFAHILLKELMYLSSIGLFSYLSISTKPKKHIILIVENSINILNKIANIRNNILEYNE